MRLKTWLLTAAAMVAATGAALPARAAEPIVGLVTKTNTNPFFVKMREGAEAEAKKQGVELRTFAGKYDGDTQTQVEAIESLISAGAKGILLTASDTVAIVPTVRKARDRGILVIELDTPLDPPNAADATFATDNFRAGQLIGQWANKTLGDKAKDAHIAMLDLAPTAVSVDVLRDTGFLSGFGITVADPRRIGTETDKRIVGHDVTKGSEEGGRTAMENLLQRDPHVNLVYTINEPAAAGAYQALKSVGRDHGVLIVSVDGGCPGVKNVKAGSLGATSMQFPLKMASEGVDAVADFAKTGKKPEATEGKTFTDTGVSLVTDKPVAGVPSITSEEGLKQCWG